MIFRGTAELETNQTYRRTSGPISVSHMTKLEELTTSPERNYKNYCRGGASQYV